MRGQAEQATALYSQALAHDPRRPEALRGLGLALSRMGRSAEAARAFERYLERRPAAPDAPRIRERLAALQASARSDL